MELLAKLVNSNEKSLENPLEQKKDLMSNLKKLESMMKEYSKHKTTSDEDRIKDISILKEHREKLTKVSLFSLQQFAKKRNRRNSSSESKTLFSR